MVLRLCSDMVHQALQNQELGKATNPTTICDAVSLHLRVIKGMDSEPRANNRKAPCDSLCSAMPSVL